MPAWDLEHAWEQRFCPMVNGVLFPDGSVVPVEGWPSGAGAPRVGVRRRLTELAGRGPVRWTTLGPLVRAVSASRALIVAAGEGGQDGDGFVALLSGPDGRLEWLAFFDDSQPFEAVAFDADEVVARTGAGRELRFPVGAPERLVVAGAAAR